MFDSKGNEIKSINDLISQEMIGEIEFMLFFKKKLIYL